MPERALLVPAGTRDNNNRQKGSTPVPVFATPQPITVTIALAVADLRLVASDRSDTRVEVRPRNRSRAGDVKAAVLTRVQYANGMLLIKGPQQRFRFGRGDEIDVSIELPAGSNVHGTTAMGEFRAEGQLGECRFYTDMGDITVDQTAKPNLNSGYGNITLDHALGQAEITTGGGTLRIRQIDGAATVKNSNGHTTIGEVTGELHISADNGQISIGRALSSVSAKSAHGSIRVGEVVRGSILLETAHGALEVGIRNGTAAWLDVTSLYGKVHNSLQALDGPQQSEQRVEVRARTAYGDITIRRST